MEPAQLIQLRQRAALATALFSLLVYLVCLWWWETKSWERFVVLQDTPKWIVYGTAWEAQWAIAACALAGTSAARLPAGRGVGAGGGESLSQRWERVQA